MPHNSLELLKSFDFHDGEVISFCHNGQNIELLFRNWQERLFNLRFVNVIGLSVFSFPSWPEKEISTSGAFIEQCINNLLQSGANESDANPGMFMQLSLSGEGYPFVIAFEIFEFSEVSQ